MPAPAEPVPRPVISSAALFRDAREVVIRHGAEEYRLRITKANKLILTK
ncbi:MAG TPA: hemin uptake protein HemP [Methylomirabilota bacterium]|nr:hemin uptake protein HemP [Methylomirabilota bacterium]